jgi:hypothetical protein
VLIELRLALDRDSAYCRRLYLDETRWIIQEFHLDRATQETGFRQQWNSTHDRIIVLDVSDVGWCRLLGKMMNFSPYSCS